MYRDNAFHCFEHASHVVNSVQKLLNRVVMADRERDGPNQRNFFASRIASDPLTQFAIVFSALIHDVDHTGVTNGQLIKDNAAIANLYKNKSIAEQNSCDLAWELLLDPGYRDLHHCIFGNETEFKRFRQLIVNVVLATDIFDQGMKDMRNSRWEKAFHPQEDSPAQSEEDEFNLKGTIALEHIMQASDVSHTMQHWHVYTKWNERLFEETYTGRFW
jgi:3'5'-cyclic nucleotide phosphodiesterase